MVQRKRYSKRETFFEMFFSSHRCPEVKVLDMNQTAKVHTWRMKQRLKEGKKKIKKGALISLKRSAYV